MPSLLVTNDFPPKLGGIQSYLYELWRRLPPSETTVLTTPHADAAEFDAAQAFRIERTRERVLLPTPFLRHRIDALAREVGADVIFLDPVLPLGAVGPRLRTAPYVVVVHGSEMTVPGRLPGTGSLARRVLRDAAGVVAAGLYPAREAARTARQALRGLVVAPGVDVERFRPPASPVEGAADRARFGIAPEGFVVLGVSRLVPRKGFDVLVDAMGGLPDAALVIAGDGRDRARLEERVRFHGLSGCTRFLGRVSDADLPALYRSADVFAVPCRDRWRGLEAEGFGVVFLEAAASGVPAVAGRSGGSHEAVVDGETGFVVEPRQVVAVRHALERLRYDDALRTRIGATARQRAVQELSYDRRAAMFAPLAAGDLGQLRPLAPA